MKADTHPNYDFITIVMTNGTTYQTRSTMGGEGKSLTLIRRCIPLGPVRPTRFLTAVAVLPASKTSLLVSSRNKVFIWLV
jgi:ribosomal protein L31